MLITSLQNQYIKQLVKLKQKKYRDEDQLFIIEGFHLVEEAMLAGVVDKLILRIGIEYSKTFEDVIYVSDEVMKKLTSTVSLVDIAAVCHYIEPKKTLGDHIVMLDDLQDPGNVGTIVRTALSFGYDDIILSNNSVDIYNEKLIRSSQGAIFKANIFHDNLLPLIAAFKQKGYVIYGTSLHNGVSLSKIKQKSKMVLIFGNEGQGISHEVLLNTDTNIFIEIKNFESLNVAVAAGICLYELRADNLD